jgi:hypothetical protein
VQVVIAADCPNKSRQVQAKKAISEFFISP